MRCVVGGNARDRAAAQSFDQRGTVVGATERRVHLQIRVERTHGLVGQAQVMRRYLSRRLEALRLRGGEQLDGLLRGEMHEVQRLALVCRKREVATDHQRFGDGGIAGEAELGGYGTLVHLAVARQRWLLLVQREGPIRDRRVLERAPHEPG
jgi:hypothetical protein